MLAASSVNLACSQRVDNADAMDTFAPDYRTGSTRFDRSQGKTGAARDVAPGKSLTEWACAGRSPG